jgi:hypothetical protein
LAFWTFAFFACVNLEDADYLAAAVAMKINDGRLRRHFLDAAAFWAPDWLACVFVLNTDFVSTVFAAEPNHKIRRLLIKLHLAGLSNSNLLY